MLSSDETISWRSLDISLERFFTSASRQGAGPGRSLPGQNKDSRDAQQSRAADRAARGRRLSDPPHSTQALLLSDGMYTIARRFGFSASHVIGGLAPDHPCGRMHGHNYEVEVILCSATLDGVGFVRDFHELSQLHDFIMATLDHRHLNDVLGHDCTTTEVISHWLYDWCMARWPEVSAVRVSETPDSWAEYRP